MLPRLRAAATALLLSSALGAQTQYHNLDAGQPGRVEDAEVMARYSLGIDLSPIQFERLAGGSTRYRAEPKLDYGILPFTELEIRIPLVQLNPPSSTGTQTSAGVAGVTVGVMHAFNVETMALPALALAGEVSLPVGALAPAQGSFFIKGLLTKTIGTMRLHLNAGGGTYAVAGPKPQGSDCPVSSTRLTVPGDSTCSTGPILIFDSPCTVAPASPRAVTASRYCMAPPMDSAVVPSAAAAGTHGGHWFAGVGLDHALAIQSTLLSADLFAERFVGLYSTIDWTAEVGLRHQLTPIIAVNAGLGRHFAGDITSSFIMGGASFEFATPPWFGR